MLHLLPPRIHVVPVPGLVPGIFLEPRSHFTSDYFVKKNLLGCKVPHARSHGILIFERFKIAQHPAGHFFGNKKGWRG